jgi:hypothetical protein
LRQGEDCAAQFVIRIPDGLFGQEIRNGANAAEAGSFFTKACRAVCIILLRVWITGMYS